MKHTENYVERLNEFVNRVEFLKERIEKDGVIHGAQSLIEELEENINLLHSLVSSQKDKKQIK